MKRNVKLLLIVILLITSVANLFSQPNGFDYRYDDAGNRKKREYTEIIYKEGSQPETQVAIQEHILKVFPNPTEGLLELSITNLTKDNKALLEIWGISGSSIFD